MFRTVSLGGGFELNGSFGIYVTMTDIPTSKTPYVAIDERGLVRSIHFFLFSCVHKLNSILWTRFWTTYVDAFFLSVRKFVSAVPTYWWSFDYIRIGMLKLSLLRRRLYCWAQNVQFVEISVVKSSGFWVQSWFSGLTWVSFRTCHALVFECWELLC